MAKIQAVFLYGRTLRKIYLVEHTGMKPRSLYYRINNDTIVTIVNSNSLCPIYQMGPEIHLDYEDSCLIWQGIQTVSLFISQATEDIRPSNSDKNLLLVLMLNLVELFRIDTRLTETRTWSKIKRYALFYGCLFTPNIERQKNQNILLTTGRKHERCLEFMAGGKKLSKNKNWVIVLPQSDAFWAVQSEMGSAACRQLEGSKACDGGLDGHDCSGMTEHTSWYHMEVYNC